MHQLLFHWIARQFPLSSIIHPTLLCIYILRYFLRCKNFANINPPESSWNKALPNSHTPWSNRTPVVRLPDRIPKLTIAACLSHSITCFSSRPHPQEGCMVPVPSCSTTTSPHTPHWSHQFQFLWRRHHRWTV